jgi:arginyl-tRNA synthetase
MTHDEVEDTADKTSIGAVKYNELKRSPVMDYVFVWDEALSMEGNSAPYLQYVNVRTKGILNKSAEKIEKMLLKNENKELEKLNRYRVKSAESIEAIARSIAADVLNKLFAISNVSREIKN